MSARGSFSTKRWVRVAVITKEILREKLDVALKEAGYVHRVAPVALMPRLEQKLAELRDEGLLSDALFEEYRQSLTFSCPREVSDSRTVIVVAWRSPAVKIRFQLESGPLEATVPPTYISSEARERCLQTLRSVLEPAGHTVARATAPVKLLAAHTGLAQYGRNNLAYVRGMGTFARLDTFCTDADLGAEDYEFKGSLRLSCCPPCRNCHHVCPTGCIPYDGTVIDARRCLTYFNEHEGDWPEDLDPGAHNSLVGCMRCQALCPANRYYLRKEKVVAEFDREETDIILQDLAPDELPPTLRAKLAALDLDEYCTVLGRNLRALRAAAG